MNLLLHRGRWFEESPPFWFGTSHKEEPPEHPRPLDEDEKGFAPKPNLTLNFGIKDLSPLWTVAAAVVSILLGASWIGFSAWLVLIRKLETDGSIIKQQPLLLALLIFSSLWSWAGLATCSYLVNRKTNERRFKKSNENKTVDQYAFWLQPGSQAVGDQVFNAFAYSQPFEAYTTSFKAHKPPRKTLFWIAVVSSILGWALQFFCLRSLHPFVSVYLLCATFIMAILRAALRARRLDPKDNEFSEAEKAKTVEGHELDWQALRIEELATSQGGGVPRTDARAGEGGMAPTRGESKWSRFSICDGYHIHGPLCHSERSEMVQDSLVYSASSSQGYHLTTVAETKNFKVADMINMATLDTDGGNARAASRVLSYRSQLAGLAARSPFESERWDAPARRAAQTLQQAIESTADYILSGRLALFASDKARWLAADSLVWTLGARYTTHSPELLQVCDSDNICVPLQRTDGRWRVNLNDLESILGLWTWSSKAMEMEATLNAVNISPVCYPDLRINGGHRLVFAVQTPERGRELGQFLSLWLPKTVKPHVTDFETIHSAMDHLIWTHNLGYKWLVDHREYTHLHTPNDRHSSNHWVTIPFLTNNQFQQRSQLLYTSFLRQLCALMEPLQSVEMVDHPNATRESLSLLEPELTPTFRLANNEVDSLVRIFVDSGLGGHDDGFSSVIPTLIACQRLPSLDQLDDQFLCQVVDLEHSQKRQEAGALLCQWSASTIEIPKDRERGGSRKSRVVRLWVGICRRMLRTSERSCEKTEQDLVHRVRNAVIGSNAIEFQSLRTICWWNAVEMETFIRYRHDTVSDLLAERLDYVKKIFDVDDKVQDGIDLNGNSILSILAAAKQQLPSSISHGEGVRVYCKLLEWACTTDCAEIFEDIFDFPYLMQAARQQGTLDLVKVLIENEATLSLEAILQFPRPFFDEDRPGTPGLEIYQGRWLLSASGLDNPKMVQLLLRSPTARRDLALFLPQSVLSPPSAGGSPENPESLESSDPYRDLSANLFRNLGTRDSLHIGDFEDSQDLGFVNAHGRLIMACLPDPISYCLCYTIENRSSELMRQLCSHNLGNTNLNLIRVGTELCSVPLKIIKEEWFDGFETILTRPEVDMMGRFRSKPVTKGSYTLVSGIRAEGCTNALAEIIQQKWTDGLRVLLARHPVIRTETGTFIFEFVDAREWSKFTALALVARYEWEQGLEMLIDDPDLNLGVTAYEVVDGRGGGVSSKLTAVGFVSQQLWLKGLQKLLNHPRADVVSLVGYSRDFRRTVLGEVATINWTEGLRYLLDEPRVQVGAFVSQDSTAPYAKETVLAVALRRKWTEGLEILLGHPRVDVRAVARKTVEETWTALEIAEEERWEEGKKLIQTALAPSEGQGSHV